MNQFTCSDVNEPVCMYHIDYKLNKNYSFIQQMQNISSHTCPSIAILLKNNIKKSFNSSQSFTLLFSFILTSEKSIPFFGKGTKPGSKNDARACENIERKINVDIIKAFNIPYKLEQRKSLHEFSLN